MRLKYFFALSLTVSAVFAQTDDLSKLLEATTEIATKARINADYMPGSVNIIKGEELKALGILNLNQPNALDMITGMDSSVNALRGSGSVYGGQGNKIKWLVNGRALSSQLWGGFVWGRSNISFPITVDQIDRIEVFRGPDSAVNGDNAVFGVVNIITKSSKDSIGSQNSASASFSKSDSGKWNRQTDVNARYEKDDFRLSLSAMTYNKDGDSFFIGENGNFANSVTGGHTPGYGPGNIANANDGYSLFIETNYKDWSLWANKMKTKYAQGALGTWYPTDMLPKDDGKKIGADELSSIGFKKEFIFHHLTITPSASFNIVESKLDDYMGIHPSYMTSNIEGVRDYLYREHRKKAKIDFEYRRGSHIVSGEAMFQSTSNVKDERSRNFDYYGPWPLDVWTSASYSSTLATTPNTKRLQKAGYIQDIWDIGEKTTVIVGARYDMFSGDAKFSGLSPRLAMVYRGIGNNILKAQYSRAFRAPNFIEADELKKAGVKAETVDTVELAHIFKDDKFSVKTTVFESRIYNMITFNDLTYDTENLPNMGTLRGVEYEVKYEGESFKAGLNQAFYKSEAKQRVYNSPYSIFSFKFDGGAFTLAPTSSTNIFLTLNQKTRYPTTLWYHYIGGKKRKNSFSTEDPYYIASPNGNVDPQDYLNVTQQIKSVVKNLDLSFGVQNVFGKTQKTLYMPLSQPNTKDIPYMGQSFWVNASYRF